MNNIHSIEELRAEIGRLKSVAKQQEELLRDDMVRVKEDLKPVNLVSNAFTSLTGIKLNRNALLKDGMAIGLSLLLQRFVFRTEKKIESKLAEYLGQLLEKIKQTVHSFSGKKEDENDEAG